MDTETIRALGHWDTSALKALSHLSTRVLGHLRNLTLRQSGTQNTWVLGHSRHFTFQTHVKIMFICDFFTLDDTFFNQKHFFVSVVKIYLKMYMILCYYLQLQTLINNILFLLHLTILIAVRIPQQASTTTKVKKKRCLQEFPEKPTKTWK